jgi:hypothetical protein
MAAIMPASGGLCPRASGRRRAAYLQLAPSSHKKLGTSEPGGIVRCLIAVLLLLSSSAATARAQPPATSFTELQSRLHIGETVLVTDDAGQTVKGTVEQMSDVVLILRSQMHDRQLAAATVQRVARLVHPVREGALIGLVVGFAAGAIVASNSGCTYTCFSKPAGVLLIGGIFGAIGTGAGALVGASIHRQRVVFEKAVTGRSQAIIAPLLPRRGAGLLVKVNF